MCAPAVGRRRTGRSTAVHLALQVAYCGATPSRDPTLGGHPAFYAMPLYLPEIGCLPENP